MFISSHVILKLVLLNFSYHRVGIGYKTVICPERGLAINLAWNFKRWLDLELQNRWIYCNTDNHIMISVHPIAVSIYRNIVIYCNISTFYRALIWNLSKKSFTWPTIPLVVRESTTKYRTRKWTGRSEGEEEIKKSILPVWRLSGLLLLWSFSCY